MKAHLSTTEEHRNRVYREERQWRRKAKANTVQDKNQGRKQEDKEHQNDKQVLEEYWLAYLNCETYVTHR